MPTEIPQSPRTLSNGQVWEISGSNEVGWYLEGNSDALYPENHPHQPGEHIGWFSIEVETWDEVLQQLQELGFIPGKGT